MPIISQPPAMQLSNSKLRLLLPFLACLALLPTALLAQLGGSQAFSSLSLPSSTQQLALGSYNITAPCQDVSRQLQNPALLSDTLGGWVQANYQAYFASTSGLSLAYAQELPVGILGVAFRRIGFGEIKGYNALGQAQGTFSPSDLLVQVSYAHQKGAYRWGASAKWAQSSLDGYQSSALLFDLGALFIHPEKDLQVGLAVKNIGFRLSSFYGSQDFRPPLDVQLGMSFKPERMPLRLSLTAHHLQGFDIAYEDPALLQQTDPLGNPLEEEVSFADKLARHFAIGGEFVLGKVLKAQFGYNFLKRRELIVDNRPGTVGFSWGLTLQTPKWQASFGRDAFFIGEGVSSFSMAFRPADFIRKKRVIE